MPTVVINQPRLLQGSGRYGNASPAGAQHARQKILGQLEVGGLGKIARLQQPAGQACFNSMKTVAGGGFGSPGPEMPGCKAAEWLAGCPPEQTLVGE